MGICPLSRRVLPAAFFFMNIPADEKVSMDIPVHTPYNGGGFKL